MALFLTVGLALAGCRLGVTATAEVTGDGSGTASVELHLDDRLLEELDAIGVDPTAELEAALPAAEGWNLERRGAEDGLTLLLRHEVGDAGAFGATFRSLSAGLTGDDPALLVDIEVLVDDEGATSVAGTVGFRPPATAGATLNGEAVGPDAERLEELVREHVHPRLTVTLPGRIVEHDADALDGRTLTWDVPVAAQRAVAASAAPPTWFDRMFDRVPDRVPVPVLAVAALALVLLLAIGVVGRARR